MVDAERLFSPELAQFMRRKGYDYEAAFIEAVGDCRGSLRARAVPL